MNIGLISQRRRLRAAHGIDFGGKTNRYEGDSMTWGYIDDETQASYRWSKLLSDEHNAVEDNQGVSGKGLQDEISNYPCFGGAFEASSVPSKTETDGYLFIGYSGNDALIVLDDINLFNFKRQYHSKLIELVNKGWNLDEIVLLDGYWFKDYGLGAYIGECGVGSAATRDGVNLYFEAVREVAEERGTILARTAQITTDDPQYDSTMIDGLHAGQYGHRIIADYLGSLVYETEKTRPLLTGATRFDPGIPIDSGLNGYRYQNPNPSQELIQVVSGLELQGDGFIAMRMKTDTGFGLFIGTSDFSEFKGFFRSNEDGNFYIAQANTEDIPLVLEAGSYYILRRQAGKLELLIGETLESATVVYDFGLVSETVIIISNQGYTENNVKYLDDPQGQGLTAV